MHSRRLSHPVALAALIGILAALTTSSHAQQPVAAQFVPGEVIVQFKAGVSEAQKSSVLDAHQATTKTSYELLRIQTVTVPPAADPAALALAFTAHPEVEAAQPNYIRHTTSVDSPNDPHYVNGLMYGLPKVSAPLAWSSFGAGAETVIVADIDTGVNYNHPDLAANMWVNPGEIAGNLIDDDNNGYVDDIYGIDAVNNDSNPLDDHGHGTHTSGTFGAVSDNGIGITGLAKNVRILACKFIAANGFGSDADAIECFNYVVAMKQRGNNIRVTNNSWGGSGPAPAMKNAIDAAGTAGMINIFAAGNDNNNNDVNPSYPASFTSPSIVSVAASDQNDARATFANGASNYGAVSVDLAAPGKDILSTYGNGYAYLSGTSMATPHVAGAAAFLLSHRPALTVAETKAALLSSVDVLGNWNGLVATSGRLNVFQAVTIAPGGGGGLTNVAAAGAGATATASSSYSASYGPGGAIDGDRQGLNWGNGGGWNDGTANVFPDSLQVDFAGSKTISEVDVFSVQDNYGSPSTPTQAMTFTAYGLRDFEVQYWNGSAFQAVPGATVTGNNLVWRKFTFSPITTTRIRVLVTQALASYSRLAEVEAWGTNAGGGGNTPPTVSLTSPTEGAIFTAPAAITLTASATDTAPGTVNSVSFYQNGTLIATDATGPYSLDWTGVPVGNYSLTAVALDNEGATTTSAAVNVTVTAPGGGGLTNVAAAGAGATATASSSYSASYGPGGAIDGDRQGLNWGAGGGWNDATANVFPDSLQVDFAGSKTISEVDVFSVQDNYGSPSMPTQAMTFSFYGVRDFEVQYWNGSAFQTVPGATVTGNNLVWRKFTFSPITTTRIRVLVTQALASYSRLAEVEAWGTNAGGGGNTPPTVSLTSPTEGAIFTAPAAITLTASATDTAPGTVNSVSFYQNGTLIGTDATGPYSVDWLNVPVGNYSLTAVALDNEGATTTSAAVNITVNPPGGGGLVNVAAAAAGATAIASSSYDARFAPSGANNGDRAGTNWGAGGGWNDATASVYPDWLEIDFSGSKTITEADVFTVQDNYGSPSVPTQAMTFTAYGLRDFEVQYWTGTVWQTIPGTVVTGNNLVWRHFTFAPITTTKIRVLVTQALASYSRLAEVEAWGQ